MRTTVPLALLLLVVLCAPAAADTFLYVHDVDTGDVHGFAADLKTGALATLPGSPFQSPGEPTSCGGFCMTMDTGRRGKEHLLFTSAGSGLVPWLVAEDGSLTPAEGAPFGRPSQLLGCAAVKRGSRLFVYQSDYEQSALLGWEVLDGGVAQALPGSPFACSESPDGLDAAKKRLVVAGEGGTLDAFVVEKDGVLTPAPGGPADVPAAFMYNAQLNPGGRYLYCADSDESLFAFTLDPKTAELTAVTGAPFTVGLPGQGVGTDVLKKRFVIAHDSLHGQIEVLRRAKDGSLTGIAGPVPLPEAPGEVDVHVVDRKGRWLFVTGEQAAGVASYRLDLDDGTVQLGDIEPAAVGNPTAMVLVYR